VFVRSFSGVSVVRSMQPYYRGPNPYGNSWGLYTHQRRAVRRCISPMRTRHACEASPSCMDHVAHWGVSGTLSVNTSANQTRKRNRTIHLAYNLLLTRCCISSELVPSEGSQDDGDYTGLWLKIKAGSLRYTHACTFGSSSLTSYMSPFIEGL
jgi:hypothetical protein